jgi:transposase
LEKGRLGWPVPVIGQDKVVLSQEELALLLGGIDLAGTRRRRWYRESAAAGQ